MANKNFKVSSGLDVDGTVNANGLITGGSISIQGDGSTAANINGVTIGGTTPAAGTFTNLVANTIASNDSTAVQINDAVNISGTLTANTFVTNDISSGDSTAIQINDGMNISGSLTANTLKTDSTATISGTLTANTIVTNDISSTDSTAVQINDGMNISGTLTANTFVTNNISSSESTAIQINDGMNISGTLTANTFVTNNISSAESSAIQINDAVYVGGQIQATGGWAGTVSSAGKLGGIVQAFNCERSGAGSIGGILSYGNGLATGKGLRMPFAGKLLAATLAGTAIEGTVTLDAYLNEVANNSYRLTQTNGIAAGVGVTQDFQSSPLSFAAGDFLGWYQTAVPTSANGYSVSYYVIFD